MNEKRRASDNPATGWFWVTLRKLDGVFKRAGSIISLVVATAAVFIAGYAVFNVEAAVDDIAATQKAANFETLERRDQTCHIFESQHLTNVRRLEGTYEFLDNLPRSEWGSPLTRAVLRGLPALEAEARVDQAPPYCDEPGEAQEFLYQKSNGKRGLPPIGLPEPDPELPVRRSFKRMAQEP
jgi:hypothetical protein